MMVLGGLMLLGASVGAWLVSARAGTDADESVVATIWQPGGQTREVVLVRGEDRWIAATAADDFPRPSVAHVAPTSSPGFFLVRTAAGAFRAYADRSPHAGEALQLRDPLPGTAGHADGPQPGFEDAVAGDTYTLDGEPFGGPGPRPLDPFAVRLARDGHLEVATRAVCADGFPQPPAWCGAAEAGPHTIASGRAVVLLPAGGSLWVWSEPGLRAGSAPLRRLTGQELRAWGFVVVSSLADLDRHVVAGTRVVWLAGSLLDQVPDDWVRRRYDAGMAVGVLDGTMADLSMRVSPGAWASSGWLQPGTDRPVFALLQSAERGQRAQSDWLTLAWLLATSSGPGEMLGS